MQKFYLVVLGLTLVIAASALPVTNPDLRCPNPIYENQYTKATILADPDSCGSFYVCAHGRPIRLNCPDGLHYNPRLQVCVPLTIYFCCLCLMPFYSSGL